MFSEKVAKPMLLFSAKSLAPILSSTKRHIHYYTGKSLGPSLIFIYLLHLGVSRAR